MREIGGDFCIADLHYGLSTASYCDLISAWQSSSALSFFATGRAAYYAMLNHIVSKIGHPLTVALPSYLCPSMIEPVRACGLPFVFYRVRADLSIDIDHLRRIIEAGPCIIVICDYFGFHTSSQALDDPDLHLTDGHYVLYDATHCALDQEMSRKTLWRPYAFIMSLRKMLPVVDGALVQWSDGDSMLDPRNSIGLSRSASLRSLAMLLKGSYILDGYGDKEVYLSMYRASEDLINDEYETVYGMSTLSWSFLRRIDVDVTRSRRRRNYLLLLEVFESIKDAEPLFPVLPDDTYPLGFPILIERRDELRSLLRNRAIYCPIHWVLPSELPYEEFKESHWLSNRILTIPCDQRYEAGDMTRIGETIAESLEATPNSLE